MLKLVDGSDVEGVPNTQAHLQETIDSLGLDEKSVGEFIIIYSSDNETRILSNTPTIEGLVYTLELSKLNCMGGGGE